MWRGSRFVSTIVSIIMETLLTKKEVDAYRRAKWRPGKLRTLDEAAAFVDGAGMCLLFACRDIPLPKLYDCAADGVNWWPWKDLLQEKKLAYGGRIVRRKATLVSMELLPAFYAVYQTGGGYAMYEEEYYWGRLGELANRVAEHLDRNGPTPTDVLRRAVVPSGKQHTRSFHAALLELQSKFKVVTVGLEDRGWGVRALDLFVNWVPEKIDRRAERMERREALKSILEAFVSTAGAVPEAAAARAFGWHSAEALAAVDSLIESGRIRRARFRGDPRKPWLAVADFR
jgi:hypothetical protein